MECKNLTGKWQIFKRNKRAYWSLVLFGAFFLLSLFAEIWINDKPLIVSYKNKLYFPMATEYAETVFGGDFPTPTDYKDPLVVRNIQENGWMIFPLVEFSFNTVDYDLDKPTPSEPDKKHWLGTDDEGRDVLARIVYGLRLSIVFAFLLATISSLIGIIVGALQGYLGGKTDIILQRCLEIWDALPQLFILIIVASVFTPSFMGLLIIMLFFSWTSLTGVVRAEFLRVRNFEFVKAAKVLGVSDIRIIFRHILPNALVSSITFIPFITAEAIVALTALDFLGLGLGHEYPSLGDLVRQGKDNLQSPWLGISIFIVLSGILSMFIFIGEGVRDIFDSRRNR